MHSKLKFYLPVAFIEGATVMAVELTGAKLISPWFGTSLYVWSSVLGVTMMGLAAGYFSGGIISERMKNSGVLFVILTLAAFFTALMPLSGPWIMEATQSWDPRAGALLSACIFILPPMILLGTVSPVIIRICALEPEKTGKISGMVYAVSTMGGVATTFITGFLLIPWLGLKKPILIFAALILLPVLLRLVRRKFPTGNWIYLLVAGAVSMVIIGSVSPLPDLKDLDTKIEIENSPVNNTLPIEVPDLLTPAHPINP